MIIAFYDEDDSLIAKLATDANDIWEACEEGERYLRSGTIAGADEFDILDE